MSFDFSKIKEKLSSLFPGFDLSDPKTRSGLLMLLGAGAALLLLVILMFAGSGPKEEDAVAPAATESSSVPPVQAGEDLDRIEGRSLVEQRERRGRSDNGDFARRMFQDGAIEDLLAEKKDDDTSSASAGGTAPGASAPVDMTDPLAVIARASAEGDREYGTPSSSAAAQEPSPAPVSATPTGGTHGSSRSSASSRRYSREEAAEARRQRVREMGYDPDTGMPLGSKDETPAKEAEAEEDAKARTVVPEGVEKASVSVRGKGSMSSFGTGTSSASGSGFSSFGSAEQEAVASGAKFFKVAFAYDEKLKTGQRVTLRLREKITVDGYELPVNSIVYATCSTKGERLLLRVRNIDINGKAYYLNYEAVDVDWEEGLYCPSKESARKVKQAAREVGQIISSTMSGLIPGVPGRIVQSGSSMVQSQDGNVTVSVTEGYEFYLVPGTEKDF